MPPVSGLVQNNPANTTQGKHIHNYSNFDKSLSYRLYNTLRFADYTPSFVFEGVPKDVVTLNSSDKIDSLSLNAPFKGTIRKIKESFMVPNMAILPLQWDRIYAQPTIGDDVPTDCNCVIENFTDQAATLSQSIITQIVAAFNSNTGSSVDTAKIANVIYTLSRGLTIMEYFYSTGSLLNVLGYKGNAQYYFIHQEGVGSSAKLQKWNFDKFYDDIILAFFGKIICFKVTFSNGDEFVVRGLSPNEPPVPASIPLRDFLDRVRDGNYYTIDPYQVYTDFTSAVDISGFNSIYFSSGQHQFITVTDNSSASDITTLSSRNLNLSRLLAYQLIVSHFYSNSNVDFIYSAELYREYVFNAISLYMNLLNQTFQSQFMWNGTLLQYDNLSGHYLQLLFNINSYSSNFLTQSTSTYWFAAMSAIFGFRKALRFGDYFTGSRTRPLAPINTDVSVNNSMVSVVDITRNIQAQRFANSVMRSGRKIEEYVASLFGKAPQPDFHNPFFLTRQEETIFGDSVQNTGDAQVLAPNSRTANFASRLSQHTFTFHNDDMHPCIYMQIISFDTKRAYSRSVDRHFLHIDRYDMFNPDFQYIGDQPVYSIELGYPNSGGVLNGIFGYQGRDMEYKQNFDQCSSGFASGSLPGWSFTDYDLPNYDLSQLDPDFIRSRNTDLDYLYLSLTGYSLGNYFHFICITDNFISAKRPMAIDPQILA